MENILGGGGFLNPNRQGRRGGGPDRWMLLMLLGRILEMGIDKIPPITLAVTGFCIAIALQLVPVIRTLQRAGQCFTAISFLRAPSAALGLLTVKHGIQSTFIHHGDYHLYFTMLSWLYKARAEERHRGSEFLLLWTLVTIVATTLTFIGMSGMIAWIVDPESVGFLADWIDPNNCACGLSAVLFALKSSYQYGGRARLPRDAQREGDDQLRHGWGWGYGWGWGWGWWWNPFSFLPPAVRDNVWLEILVLEILVSRVSLLWHLSGVVCGMAMSQWGVDEWLKGPAGFLRRARKALIYNAQQPHRQQEQPRR